MKLKLMMVLLIVMSGTFFNTTLFAQGPGSAQCQGNMGKGNGMKEGQKAGCCGISDLTAEQQKQIDALKLNLMKESMAIKNQIEEKKAHLITVSSGDNVDMTAVNKTIDELFALKADLVKKHQAFKQDVRKLLTADQKVVFDLNQAKKQGKGSKDCKGMGGKGHHGMKCQSNSGCQMGNGGSGCQMGNGGSGCQMGNGGSGCQKGSGGSGCPQKDTK